MEDCKKIWSMQEKNVDHPKHYNQSGFECIEVMEAIFGIEAVIQFCKLNAFKYMWRSNHKGSMFEDIAKCQWYLNKVAELENKRDMEGYTE